MSGIDAQKLVRLQEKWAEISLKLLGQFKNTERTLEEISQSLGDMGLDLDQDATYDLLAPGLGAKEFYQTQSFVSLLGLIDTYHRSQTLTSQYGDGYLYSRCANLERLLNYNLPEFEKLNAKAGLSPWVTPLMLRELDLIRVAAQDGTFVVEIKKACNEIAQSQFRSASASRDDAEKSNNNGDYRCYTHGLEQAKSALDNIEKAQEFYTPGLIPMEPGRLGWGWRKEGKTASFNRAEVESLKGYFIMKICGVEFTEAKAYQDKCMFVLDSSGSGHGAMTLPMQRILERLQDVKYDIRDPQVYLGMGTDIDTFWDCYHRERQVALAAGQYAHLLKPELTR